MGHFHYGFIWLHYPQNSYYIPLSNLFKCCDRSKVKQQ